MGIEKVSINEIIEDQKNGLTVREIARKHGVNDSTVSIKIKKHGLPTTYTDRYHGKEWKLLAKNTWRGDGRLLSVTMIYLKELGFKTENKLQAKIEVENGYLKITVRECETM